MGMTRATFLIAAGMVIALVVAAAGIGAYVAVRRNATPPTAVAGDPAPEARGAAAVHGIDTRAGAGEPSSARGIAVEATEQTVEPAAATGTEQPTAETRRARRPEPGPPIREEPAPRRAAARPTPAPAPRPAARPRREPSPPATVEQVERSAPRPVPTAAETESASTQEATTPTQPGLPSRATGRFPEIDGWRPAVPEPPTAAPEPPCA